VSTDPEDGSSGDPVSLHRYLYASDDPVNKDDPTGRYFEWLHSPKGGQSAFYTTSYGIWNGPSPTTPAVPPDCNLTANIRLAILRQGNFIWMYEMAHTGGPWDYKDRPFGGPDDSRMKTADLTPGELTWRRFYGPWGDFHFGVVGTAAKFTPTYLYQAAGYADRNKPQYNLDGSLNAESWINNPFWGALPVMANPITGTFYGGLGPNYGDDEPGHELIVDGIRYFNDWWTVTNKTVYDEDQYEYLSPFFAAQQLEVEFPAGDFTGL
jgi:hypothetical protein